MTRDPRPAFRSYDGPFAFTSAAGHEGRCYVQVYEPRGGDLPIVIACEMSQNPGPSITNAAAAVATQVWRQLLPHAREGLRWIELYKDGQGGETEPAERFAEVTFDLDGDALHSPRWRHIARADVERLIGGPVSVPITTSY